jgi:hypothetical protein
MWKDGDEIRGAEYFVTFINDKSGYVWIYPLKQKGDVFEKFLK